MAQRYKVLASYPTIFSHNLTVCPLGLPFSCFAGFVMAMEDNWSSSSVVVFDWVILVTASLIKETEISLLIQEQERVLEGEARNRDTILKHINVLLLPKCKIRSCSCFASAISPKLFISGEVRYRLVQGIFARSLAYASKDLPNLNPRVLHTLPAIFRSSLRFIFSTAISRK